MITCAPITKPAINAIVLSHLFLFGLVVFGVENDAAATFPPVPPSLPAEIVAAKAEVDDLNPTDRASMVGEISTGAALHPKIDPAVYLMGSAQEVFVCLLDKAGNVAPDYASFHEVSSIIGIDRIINCYSPDTFLAVLTRTEIEMLAEHPLVEAIASNIPRFRPSLYDAVEIVHAVEAWQVEANGLKLTGQGTAIAVIDTGMDWTHPDLAGKNVVGCNLNCFDEPDSCFIDCSNTDILGHGTRR